MIFVPELVMHNIELMCTCAHLNEYYGTLTFCWQLMTLHETNTPKETTLWIYC